jgi:hypothetical protein
MACHLGNDLSRPAVDTRHSSSVADFSAEGSQPLSIKAHTVALPKRGWWGNPRQRFDRQDEKGKKQNTATGKRSSPASGAKAVCIGLELSVTTIAKELLGATTVI